MLRFFQRQQGCSSSGGTDKHVISKDRESHPRLLRANGSSISLAVLWYQMPFGLSSAAYMRWESNTLSILLPVFTVVTRQSNPRAAFSSIVCTLVSFPSRVLARMRWKDARKTLYVGIKEMALAVFSCPRQLLMTLQYTYWKCKKNISNLICRVRYLDTPPIHVVLL